MRGQKFLPLENCRLGAGRKWVGGEFQGIRPGPDEAREVD